MEKRNKQKIKQIDFNKQILEIIPGYVFELLLSDIAQHLFHSVTIIIFLILKLFLPIKVTKHLLFVAF